jgi:DNA invertase Pin-like site-specific DNA recombinase
MKVIGYARVSTAEQAGGGISLEAQEAKIRAYCELHDLELVEVIIDGGESAKSLKRPRLQRGLAMLKKKVVGGLVVCKLDRLSRSVKDWNALIDGYFGEKAGKQLFSVADSIDTRTAAGRLVLNVLMSVAQWEREAIGERTRDALRHMKKTGQRVGKVPFGYSLQKDRKTLVPNPAEQGVIRAIFELREKGATLRKIAEELSRRGVQTKEGNANWTHTAVARILDRASVDNAGQVA